MRGGGRRRFAFADGRKSKIEYFDSSCWSDLDVCRFQIPMNDPTLVSRLQTFGKPKSARFSIFLSQISRTKRDRAFTTAQAASVISAARL
jgi:hypothetical protein